MANKTGAIKLHNPNDPKTRNLVEKYASRQDNVFRYVNKVLKKRSQLLPKWRVAAELAFEESLELQEATQIVETVTVMTERMDSEAYKEIAAQINVSVQQNLKLIDEWMKGADENKQTELMSLRLRALDLARKLLPENVNVDISVSENKLSDVFFDVFDVIPDEDDE